jgi:alginate O-acetyltransferase complex protein AlgI
MVFSSSIFLFAFLPIVFVLNLLLPVKYRNIFLLTASLLFYSWGEPVYVFLMLLSIAVNYYMAILISRSENTGSKKSWLILAVIFNLLLLSVFKYANFISLNFIRFFDLDLQPTSISLPIGISFFTFQAMSYIIDVYRGTSKAERNISNVALYISFFPQLIAGPIIKHHDISEQIRGRVISTEKIYSGMTRFITGLSKKILLANVLGEAADIIFKSDPSRIGSAFAWVGAAAYTLQIYFDFSGYSDMAIGLGKMFGFEFKENFNYPFTAKGLNDFWKRWHISLTNWFREYLYIPLGGNRKGIVRTYVNLLIIFLCTGFWHGAEWTFVLWGLCHGAFMLLERSNIIPVGKIKIKGLVNIYSLFVIVTTFTIFRSPDIRFAFEYLKAMFSFSSPQTVLPQVYSPFNIFIFSAAIISSLPVASYFKKISESGIYNGLRYAFSFVLLLFCFFALAGETFNPFIYFRF